MCETKKKRKEKKKKRVKVELRPFGPPTHTHTLSINPNIVRIMRLHTYTKQNASLTFLNLKNIGDFLTLANVHESNRDEFKYNN